MSKTFRPWDVDQVWLFPPTVHDFVPAGHPAHLIRDLVRDELNLRAVLAAYQEERGYPPYHPTMMVALLLYAYTQGLYASRRIAKACEERVDVMAVTGLQRPDFRTISEFRKRHRTALAGLFVQVLALCRAAGLVKLGHVALDGTRVKANASKHKAMSYGRMKQAEPALAAEVAGWLSRAEREDAADDAAHGRDRRGDELPAWVADKQARLAKIRAAKAALEAEAGAAVPADHGDDPGAGPSQAPPTGVPADTAQRNFTDPDSRILKTKDGFVQGYNAQAAVDGTAQIIVAQAVTTSGSDQAQFAPLLDQIKTNTGRRPTAVSADAGYCSEANLQAAAARGVTAYIATGRQRHGTAAPTSRRRAPPGSLVAAMAAKLKRAGRRSCYRLRKQIVEPVFGQIKHARGFRQFLLRGYAKVKDEWALLCTVHNLTKLLTARTAMAS